MSHDHHLLSRRDFTKHALAGMSAAWAARLGGGATAAALQKPDSTYGGVPIGVIAPFSFGAQATDADSVLAAMLSIGLSHVEIRGDILEAFAGAPVAARGRGRGARGGGGGGATAEDQRPAGGPPQEGARGAGRDGGPDPELTRWRLSAPMDRIAAFRKKYEDAGVKVFAFRVTLDQAMSDAEYDYVFQAAKTLGANQVTMELPADNEALTRRIGASAAKHEVYVGYHAHTQATMTSWDAALAQSPYNGIQLDVGHYVAGTNQIPLPFIEKYHARIVSMHLKDRLRGDRGGTQVPMGQGDVGLVPMLQLMKRSRYAIPSAIELSYPIPSGSTNLDEMRKCLDYCRRALV